MKFQIPSAKLQISTNNQAPNTGVLVIGIWSLEFIWNL
jgi:hypothetical protein